jgi:diguanylate cyclase (GGDEF)-like protein
VVDITSVSESNGGDAQRHFGGPYTRALISHLTDVVGADGVAEVLRASGETRTREVLLDDATWSSYAQFRALLEAGGAVLGGPDALVPVGLRLVDPADFELNPAVQALGSPEALYANAALAGAMVCPIMHAESSRVADQEWLISQWLDAEYESFAELCAVQAGIQSVSTVVFGYAPADVIEVECVRRGDPACKYRIRWDVADENERQVNFLTARVNTLEGRLEKFERTVADLVSGQDLQTLLDRTFASAAEAVRAPMCLLALSDAVPQTVEHIYSNGLSATKAKKLAAELLSTDPTTGELPDAADDSSRLVVEVASTRCHYGRLITLRPMGAFLPQELTRVQAYASFLAAALDSAAALAEAHRQEADARRQGDTARALLELSTALAEITSVEEMAAKLVRAVPTVMNCDRALVALRNTEGTSVKIVATYGYPPELDQMLKATESPIPAKLDGAPEFRQQQATGSEGYMDVTNTQASLHIPIIVDGEWAGAIVAAMTSNPEQLRPTRDAEDRLRGLAAQASTAIRNSRLLDQVRHQALHDPLTGLPNRALILDRVDQMLARARRNHHAAAAMFIDLDGFKEINDTFGHAAGDELLRAVTARLKATLRPSDTVGRLGGDEFVVLIDGVSMDAGPELVAERLLEVLRQPFDIADHHAGRLSVTASIGIATGDRTSAGDLLRDADVALYQAKAAGKNRFLIFEEQMQTNVQDHLLLQMDLANALAGSQFVLAYQPICNLASGEVTSVEALLRWEHPTRGQVQPNDFISLLEESGLILDVGRWVLIEACRQAAVWRDRGMSIDMAVNVSGRQLQNDRLLTDIRDALTLSGLDPSALVVEITESVMMTDVRASASRLRAVRALGVRIAIDDFGTGYSSLAVLRDFPVDTLKIDRAFVSGLGDTAEATALIHTLIQLGKTLGLTTLAEGIEDTTQYAQLEDQDCESGQGFLIARPMPAKDLEAFLATNNPGYVRALA